MRLLATAVLACLVLVACSGGEEPSADQPTSTMSAVIESPVGREKPSPTEEPTVVATESPLVTNEEELPGLADAPEPEASATPASFPIPVVIEDFIEEVRPTDNPQLEVPLSSPNPGEGLHRVVDVEDCLNVRALPYIEAEILDCLPEGTHARVQPYAIEGRGGVTWRRLAGQTFWGSFVSDRYLEGPEPSGIIAVPSYAPSEEFPDVALLVQPDWANFIPRHAGGAAETAGGLERIYRRSNGEVVRETLMTIEDLIEAYPEAFDGISGQYVRLAGLPGPGGLLATPGGSHIYAAACVPFGGYGYGCGFGSPVAIFESRDGGVTWSHYDTVTDEGGDSVAILGLLPDDTSDTYQLIVGTRWGDDEDVLLLPSGEIRSPPRDKVLSVYPATEAVGSLYTLRRTWSGAVEPLHDGRLAWPMVIQDNSARDTSFISWWSDDGEELGTEPYSVWLSGVGIPDHLKVPTTPFPPIPSDLRQDYLPGDQRPDGPPWDPSYSNFFSYHVDVSIPLAIQHGPFLRVTDVDDCLPILAEPSSSSEELACAAERVLLTDLGDVVTDDGLTWHRTRTPAGIEGWADTAYLE